MFAKLKQFAGKYNNRLTARQRSIVLLAAVLIAVGVAFLGPNVAHAALITDLSDPSWIIKGLSWVLINFAQLFIRIAIFFLAFIIEIAGYNGYLSSTTVNIGWVMVRDITNMFFVVMLLVIAFGTILGIEQYEWKKLIVKFVMAAVLVNFSRLICGILIDASQVLMITFVNGIVATAGGNLIHMFNLGSIWRFQSDIKGGQVTEPGVLTASVAAFAFCLMLMMTLGIFVFMLVARLVRLWILIVLSPLAFVMSVIPLTQKFSGQWWSELGDDLITGPVLLFFIWLSFVSLTGGDVNKHIAAESSIPEQSKILDDNATILGAKDTLPAEFQTAGVGDSLKWNKMANFVVAIGMLLAGAQVASQIGGSSGSALSAVANAGKKIATIATGYAAGRWLYEKGAGAVKSVAMAPLAVVKGAAMNFPIIGGRSMIRLGKYADNFRKENRFINWIPLIGGKNEEIQDKLDHRLEKRMKWKAETREAQYSNLENQTLLDRVGGKIMGGMEMVEDRDEHGNIQYEKDEDGNDLVVNGEKVKKMKEVESWWRKNIGKHIGFGLQASSALKNEAESENAQAMNQKKEKGQQRTKRMQADKAKEGGKALKLFAEQERSMEDEALGKWMAQNGHTFSGTPENKEKQRSEFMSAFLRSPMGQAFVKGQEGRLTKPGGLLEMIVSGKVGAFKDMSVTERKAVADSVRTRYFEQLGHLNDALLASSNAVANQQLESTAFGSGLVDKTVAAEHVKETNETLSKLVKATAKANYGESFKGAEEMRRKAAADLGVKAQEAGYKKTEAEAITKMATQTPEGLRDIEHAIESEKATHLEEEKLKTFKKEKEEEFYKGPHGTKELEELAILKARTDKSDSVVKQKESEAKLRLMNGEIGKGEFSVFLKSQSISKLVQDTVGSREKDLTAEENKKRVVEADEAEKEAQKIEDETRAKTTSPATKAAREAIRLANEKIDSNKLAKSKIDTELGEGNLSVKNIKAELAALDEEVKEAEEKVKAAKTPAEQAVAKKELADLKKNQGRDRSKLGAKLKTERTKIEAAKAKVGAFEAADEETKLKDEIRKNQDTLLKESKTMDPAAQREHDDGMARAMATRMKSHTWAYASAKAKEDESQQVYSVAHNRVMSNVENFVVHGKRGTITPNMALSESIERYTKQFAGMDYDMYCANLRTSLEALDNRRDVVKTAITKRDTAKAGGNLAEEAAQNKIIKDNEITESDRAEMAALLAHGEKNSWVDDATWSYMMSSSLKGKLGSELGWNDAEFNNQKINDIMAIFASGGDMQFAGMHNKVGKLMDHAKKEMGMSLATFFDKLQKGFSAEEQKAFSDAGMGKMLDQVKIKSTADADGSVASDAVKNYLKQVEEFQPQLQFIANMRDRAAASSHPENGGHGQFVTMADGKRQYVLVGNQIAQDNVMGEVRKQTVGVRAQMQTHGIADIDEDTNFATKVDQGRARDVRAGINTANDYRGTNVRFENQTGGLESDDNRNNYISDTGGFMVNGKDANGNRTGRAKWLSTSKLKAKQFAADKAKGTARGLNSEKIEAQATSNDIVNHLFAPRLRTNPNDFLLTMASLSGIDQYDALDGQMKITVAGGDGQDKTITDVGTLIEMYNSGAFNWGVPPSDRIPKFQKSSKSSDASRRKAKAEDSTPKN